MMTPTSHEHGHDSRNVTETTCGDYQVHSPMIAWNGVLILVYKAFPTAILRLKEMLSEGLYSQNISGMTSTGSRPAPRPGSLFPKTTFGVLKDGATLTDEEFLALLQVCRKYQRLLQVSDVGAVKVTSLSLVSYGNRALTEWIARVDYPLQVAGGEERSLSHESEQKSRLQSASKASSYVEAVLAECGLSTSDPDPDPSQLTPLQSQYLNLRVNNHDKPVESKPCRFKHYFGRAVGSTLVGFLSHPSNAAVFQLLQDMRREIHMVSNGKYVFMPDEALHITVFGVYDQS